MTDRLLVDLAEDGQVTVSVLGEAPGGLPEPAEPFPLTWSLDTADVVAAMVELTVRLGNATDLAYGQITFNDHGPGYCYTRLDSALHRDGDD